MGGSRPASECNLSQSVSKSAVIGGESMRTGWHFLSWRWWLLHFLGFSLIYAAGRITAAFLKG